MVTHSNILAWRIPWTEEPDRLQSTGSQRVRYDCGFHSVRYLLFLAPTPKRKIGGYFWYLPPRIAMRIELYKYVYEIMWDHKLSSMTALFISE